MNIKTVLILTTGLICLFSTQVSKALSCGDIITTNTVMTEDLHCSSGDYALEIRANNVTLDMNGYTLSGTNDLAGIIVDRQDKVTISGNGAITGFWSGINTAESNKLTVDGITFYELQSGVIISSGNEAMISNNDFIYMSSLGVSIINHIAGLTASDNSVINNEFYKNRVGIEVCGDDSDSNRLESNLIWKTEDYGINIIQSDDNSIVYNEILETGNIALRMNNASYNTIKSNSLRVGRVGLSIVADIDDRCLDAGETKSYKNFFTYNHSIDFETGIVAGAGNSKTDEVLLNEFHNNKLYDNELGIFFNTDAHFNDATINVYTGTISNVSDIGVNNLY